VSYPEGVNQGVNLGNWIKREQTDIFRSTLVVEILEISLFPQQNSDIDDGETRGAFKVVGKDKCDGVLTID
jgi:hypothetical protein